MQDMRRLEPELTHQEGVCSTVYCASAFAMSRVFNLQLCTLPFPCNSVSFHQSCWGGVSLAVLMLLVSYCCSHGLVTAHPDTTVISGFPWEVIATGVRVTLFHHPFLAPFFEAFSLC